MKILVVTEQRQGKWNNASFETLAAAQQIVADTGGTVSALVLGKGVGNFAGELAAKNIAEVLLVEHDLSMVSEVVDRTLVMDLGSLISEGTFDEVMADTVLPTYVSPAEINELVSGQLLVPCMSWHWSGTTRLKFGRLLFAKSVVSWESGTMLASAPCVPVKFRNGLCLEA